MLSAPEETSRVERSKWDAIADAEAAEATPRSSSRLVRRSRTRTSCSTSCSARRSRTTSTSSSVGVSLYRVLKTGGRAAFVEPMGMNPILNFARDHMPYRDKTLRARTTR